MNAPARYTKPISLPQDRLLRESFTPSRAPVRIVKQRRAMARTLERLGLVTVCHQAGEPMCAITDAGIDELLSELPGMVYMADDPTRGSMPTKWHRFVDCGALAGHSVLVPRATAAKILALSEVHMDSWSLCKRCQTRSESETS